MSLNQSFISDFSEYHRWSQRTKIKYKLHYGWCMGRVSFEKLWQNDTRAEPQNLEGQGKSSIAPTFSKRGYKKHLVFRYLEFWKVWFIETKMYRFEWNLIPWQSIWSVLFCFQRDSVLWEFGFLKLDCKEGMLWPPSLAWLCRWGKFNEYAAKSV